MSTIAKAIATNVPPTQLRRMLDVDAVTLVALLKIEGVVWNGGRYLSAQVLEPAFEALDDDERAPGMLPGVRITPEGVRFAGGRFVPVHYDDVRPAARPLPVKRAA